MSSSASLFPHSMAQMEQHFADLEQALASSSDTLQAHSELDDVQLSTDDLFSSFLASSTPHPSTHSLTGVDRMESSSSTDSDVSTTPTSPSSLPPLSPVSLSSPLPSPVLSPIGSMPASPSSFSLASLSSDVSFSPSSSPSPSPSPAPAKRKYTKRKASIASSESSVSSSTTSASSSSSASPVKRRGVKRELSPSPELDELDPATAKKERRKQQNRNAAATSREKKQKYMADMEARIEKLIREQQQLIDDVQRLQEQNQQLKQQVHKREAGEPQAAVKAEQQQQQQQEVQEEVQPAQCEVSEPVSQDHVSASAECAVESEYASVSGASEWSDAAEESRDVYHESAVLGAPQWQTSRTPSLTATLPLISLLPLTTLCLFLHCHWTLLLLSTAASHCPSMQHSQHQQTIRSSTRMTSPSPATTSPTTPGCSSLHESTTEDVLDMEGGHCSISCHVSCSAPSAASSFAVARCSPALMCR